MNRLGSHSFSTLRLDNPKLAINGGKPASRRSWPDNFTTGIRERIAASRAIRSGYLSLFEGSHSPDEPFSFKGGPEVRALEAEWSEFYSISNSIAMNSATSGLFASIGALGIGYGDEVIVSPYTMSACALAPLIYGAIPVFADVSPETGCLDPDSIRSKITQKTKAIIVVHQFGFPAPMGEIMEIAKANNLRVIEDCAQAHNLAIDGKLAGTIGDIGVFSLNVNKTIQSGEGGVCVTRDDDLSYRLQLIRNHGEAVVEAAGYGSLTNIAGYNYRMTEVTAAIARVQLRKLNRLTLVRLRMVSEFLDQIQGLSFLSIMGNGSSLSGSRRIPTGAYYVLPLRFDSRVAGVSRREFVNALSHEGVPIGAGYVRPLYLQPLYQKKHLFKEGYPFNAPPNSGTIQEYSKGTCPTAEQLHFESLLILEHIRPPVANRKFGKHFLTAVSKMQLVSN